MGRSYHRLVHIRKALWIGLILLGVFGGGQAGLAETKTGNDEPSAPSRKISLKPVLKPKLKRVKLTPVQKASETTTRTAEQTPEPTLESKPAPSVASEPKVTEPDQNEGNGAQKVSVTAKKIVPKNKKKAGDEAESMAEEANAKERPSIKKSAAKMTTPSEKEVASEKPAAPEKTPALKAPTAQSKELTASPKPEEFGNKAPQPKPERASTPRKAAKPEPAQATPPEKELAREQAKPAPTPSAEPKAEEAVAASQPEKEKRRGSPAEAEQQKPVEAAIVPAAKPEASPAPSTKPAPQEIAAPVESKPKPTETAAPVKTEVAAPSPKSEPAQKAVALDEATIKAALVASPTAEVRGQLRQFAKANPASSLAPEAYLRIGEISQALNDPRSAEEAYQAAALTANSAHSRQQAQSKLAMAAAQAGHFKAAAQGWAVLRQNAPEMAKDPQAINAQALALTVENDYRGAEGLWGQLEKMPASDNPTTGTITPSAKATALLGQALAAELQGQHKQAREQLERVIRNFAATPEAALARKRLVDLDKPLVQ